MDGQNFENGQNTEPVVEPTASNNYQDNTSTYTNPYQDSSSAYSSAYSSEPVQSEGGTPPLAIIGLIVGIISIPTGCCISCVGVICGIVGIVLAILANKQQKTGVGTAALICSIVGLVLGIGMMILGVILAVAGEL